MLKILRIHGNIHCSPVLLKTLSRRWDEIMSKYPLPPLSANPLGPLNSVFQVQCFMEIPHNCKTDDKFTSVLSAINYKHGCWIYSSWTLYQCEYWNILTCASIFLFQVSSRYYWKSRWCHQSCLFIPFQTDLLRTSHQTRVWGDIPR